jgi:hypothetical protein
MDIAQYLSTTEVQVTLATVAVLLIDYLIAKSPLKSNSTIQLGVAFLKTVILRGGKRR